MSRPSRSVAAPIAPLLLLLLAGCSADVGVEPAPDADDPLCAQVYTALPDGVAGLDRRDTTAQGAAAWVGPTGETVVLRCGVEPLDLLDTTDGCQAVEGDGAQVDWIPGRAREGTDGTAATVTWTTYGRSPALALVMPDDPAVTSSAPLDVGAAVALVPQTDACT